MNSSAPGKFRACLAGGGLAIALDQAAKAWTAWGVVESRVVVFSFSNHELAFVPARSLSLGFGQIGHGGEPWEAAGLLGVAGLVAALALFFYRGLAPGERLNGFALGLVLGGVLGNLFDWFSGGSVTGILQWVSATPREDSFFNPADVFIALGVLILLVELLVAEGAARVLSEPPQEKDD